MFPARHPSPVTRYQGRTMSCAGRGIVLRQIDRLFRDGTLGGLADRQLLERYLTRRDETAFEALVDLHGPMVLGLCRRMLCDPRDIEDAFPGDVPGAGPQGAGDSRPRSLVELALRRGIPGRSTRPKPDTSPPWP